jgi:hypothetical protein
VPLLYNGQEVESAQRLPLFEKEAIDWDRPGADATRAFYRRIVELARRHDAFRSGPLQQVETDAPEDVIAYRRGDVVVLVNARPRALAVSLSGVDPDGARDLLSDRIQRGSTIELPAYGVVLLARE